MKKPIRVAVTGAAGNIGYALLFRIAAGDMLGKDQPVILQLLDLPQAQDKVKGVMMELLDCAFPLLVGMSTSDNPEVAFKDAEIAILVGSRPRSPGMERADLLQANAEIFKVQGAALNKVADRNVKVLVVGNPANTNALITAHFAPDLPKENITAMLRLDHNRAFSQLAEKTGKHIDQLEKMFVWGNHSPTMYADWSYATLEGKPVKDVVNDDKWYHETFIPKVGKRGAEILNARGQSSAASAASAAIDHIHDWVLGSNGKWVTMGVMSDGSYGIPEGIICGVPVICEGGKYTRVKDVEIKPEVKPYIDKTVAELQSEKDAIKHLLV